MKTIAVICELNPCHNGHARLFREAKRLSGADHLVAVMSGNFVQRGEPALFDKYVRTKTALCCGVDLVLELPVSVSTGSARRFAEGAADILDRLGCVDELWFGSEAGCIEPFLALASVLHYETPLFQKKLREALANGSTFARAQDLARTAVLAEAVHNAPDLAGCCGLPASSLPPIPDITDSFFQKPNNILGLEYCLALRRLGSSIRPRTLKRVRTLQGRKFLSSSEIRRLILSGESADVINSYLPVPLQALHNIQTAEDLLHANTVTADDFSDMLRYALWTETADSLVSYEDVSPQLANRILNLRPDFTAFPAFSELLKTKDMTLSRIRRALLHILLRIRREQTGQPNSASLPVRLLGHSCPDELFSLIKKNGRLTLLSRGADLSDPGYAGDLFASQLYESVRSAKSETPFVPEENRPVLTLKQP
ncbi:MAG: nucleotidyltransferase family protein [Eubacterium sp.]|nr:nucleotidyltransferase family protein [Eubacterium sp.]